MFKRFRFFFSWSLYDEYFLMNYLQLPDLRPSKHPRNLLCPFSYVLVKKKNNYNVTLNLLIDGNDVDKKIKVNNGVMLFIIIIIFCFSRNHENSIIRLRTCVEKVAFFESTDIANLRNRTKLRNYTYIGLFTTFTKIIAIIVVHSRASSFCP